MENLTCVTSVETQNKRGGQGSCFLNLNNMRTLLLLAVLLCVLSIAQAQMQDNTNTLKLCGRAFVRAVVFTCGGSRWRRMMGEEETFQDSE